MSTYYCCSYQCVKKAVIIFNVFFWVSFHFFMKLITYGSLNWEVWVHQISLTPPLFIEVYGPGQENERSCIRVLGVSIFPLFTIFLLDFATFRTVWDFLFFILFGHICTTKFTLISFIQEHTPFF